MNFKDASDLYESSVRGITLAEERIKDLEEQLKSQREHLEKMRVDRHTGVSEMQRHFQKTAGQSALPVVRETVDQQIRRFVNEGRLQNMPIRVEFKPSKGRKKNS